MKGHPIIYSAAELRWLKANRKLPISEYAQEFCRKFCRDVAAKNLHALRKRNGWRTGRTGCFEKGLIPHNKGKPHPAGRSPGAAKNHFRKGNLPHNTNYLGHERVSKDGYVEISVDETNPHTGFERRYVLKHRWLWEKANGPVPAGYALKCKGDRANTDPSNWELVSRALLPRLSGRYGRGYDEAPNELKPTILAVTKLEYRVRESRTDRSETHEWSQRICSGDPK
ncbi:HNH endonuclease [Bradyrhizobium elkanii]|uniref:HNH endonuclease n=1 Tax=Bradyrhizobium elkanii TaxID=29448 RepID=UPI002169313B|nr:HNH endonuclease [Bradyrhizobium elkanii]MCS3690889.1 hypothetical protein [Bradyrhizobium elkanii]